MAPGPGLSLPQEYLFILYMSRSSSCNPKYGLVYEQVDKWIDKWIGLDGSTCMLSLESRYLSLGGVGCNVVT